MKLLRLLLIITVFLNVFSVWGQTTQGKDFWLTFGKNRAVPYNDADLQIRIVSGSKPVLAGKIYFTDLATSIDFSIDALQVYTYSLIETEKQAVYNTATGTSNFSVHITTDEEVTVFVLNQYFASADATNILPTDILSDEYYHISYTPFSSYLDAYAVIAPQNNTQVYHNGIPTAILDAGQVYYRTDSTDMTGAYITANHPVAFFALNQGTQIPINVASPDCLMQQLAPVTTWGNTFFVPVSHATKDIVRIVASENNTNITQTGGALRSSAGSQMSLNNLQAGQFVELDILNQDGCYIVSDKSVGVCAYLSGTNYHLNLPLSDPSQSWLAPIEQAVTSVLMAPFKPNGDTNLDDHRAVIITPTVTKDNTKVSIGGAPPTALSGGNWVDNTVAGISSYNMPLTQDTLSYYFTNDEGLFVMGYGVGSAESYYYLAGSGMRNLKAGFYANDIYYKDLDDQVLCVQEVEFRAVIEVANIEILSIKWYIDEIEEVSAQNLKIWSKNFTPGDYTVRLEVEPDEGEIKVMEGILHIGAIITTTPNPLAGGTTTGDGCYLQGSTVTVAATPHTDYRFASWTMNGIQVSDNNVWTFLADDDVDLVANFTLNNYSVNIEVNNSDYGYATGSGDYPAHTSVTVEVFPNFCYQFKNWTIDSVVVSESMKYTFQITEDVILLANFYALDFDTYTFTLWDNTFLLNLRKLREDGYEVTGCQWFKNGEELTEFNTIDEFSYSAGPNITDLLEPEPAWYSFMINTENHGFLCSTHKTVQGAPPNKSALLVYPNPVSSGSQFTLKGVTKDERIDIYNCYGACVKSIVAADATITLALSFPPGIYLIRANEMIIKIMISD